MLYDASVLVKWIICFHIHTPFHPWDPCFVFFLFFCLFQSSIRSSRQALKWDDTHFKDVNIKQTRFRCRSRANGDEGSLPSLLCVSEMISGWGRAQTVTARKVSAALFGRLPRQTRLYIGQGENLVTPAQATQISPALPFSLFLHTFSRSTLLLCCHFNISHFLHVRSDGTFYTFSTSWEEKTGIFFFFRNLQQMSGLFKAVHLNANHSPPSRMFMITVVHPPSPGFPW